MSSHKTYAMTRAEEIVETYNADGALIDSIYPGTYERIGFKKIWFLEDFVVGKWSWIEVDLLTHRCTVGTSYSRTGPLWSKIVLWIITLTCAAVIALSTYWLINH